VSPKQGTRQRGAAAAATRHIASFPIDEIIIIII